MSAINPNEMEQVANDFLSSLDKREDRLDSPERREQETQIYWESENLQLNRQNEMGIRETLVFEPLKLTRKEKKQGVKYPEGRVVGHKEGTVRTGTSLRLGRVRRTIWKDEKIVKKFHSYCDTRVNLLQSDVDHDARVACPNCGAYGKIESYIDGCDFCGSQFEVKDFKPKVSDFSVIESTEQMASRMQSGIMKAYFIMFLTIWSIGFFGTWIFFLVLKATGDYSILESVTNTITLHTSGAGAFLLYNISDKVFGSLFKAFFIVFFSTIFFSFFRKSQIPVCNTDRVEGVFPDFSESEFRQEVEHRLRTMFMSDNINQAMAYSDCDLSAFLPAHRDVFDMSIAKIEFLQAWYDPQYRNYLVEANISVKLYRCKEKGPSRIKEEYEKLHVLFSQSEGIDRKNSTAIRQYKCPGCGSGINIFEGNACHYCGHILDKHSLGLVLQQCQWSKQVNLYRLIPAVILAVSAVIMIL